MINILIRTSNRPVKFKRCLESVLRQTYSPLRVIVSYDNDEALQYIPENIERVKVTPEGGKRFFYNLYCNTLKELVTEGWFMFLDDDDYFLTPDVLKDISIHLCEDRAVICQFLRGGRPKPKDQLMNSCSIEVGHIGLPSLFLHSKHKGIADVGGDNDFDDYRYIKKVADLLPAKFVKIPVVCAERRGWGKQ